MRKWKLLNREHELFGEVPSEGQEIYFSVNSGDGFGPVSRVAYQRCMLLPALDAHPDYLIIWQEVPAPPQAPINYRVVTEHRCERLLNPKLCRCEHDDDGGLYCMSPSLCTAKCDFKEITYN